MGTSPPPCIVCGGMTLPYSVCCVFPAEVFITYSVTHTLFSLLFRPNFALIEQGLNRLLTVAMSAEPKFKSLEENFYLLLKTGRFEVVGL